MFNRLICRFFGHLRRKRMTLDEGPFAKRDVLKCPRCGDLKDAPAKAKAA